MTDRIYSIPKARLSLVSSCLPTDGETMLLNGLPVGYAVYVFVRVRQIVKGAAVFRNMRYACRLGIFLYYHFNFLIFRHVDFFQGMKNAVLKNGMDGLFHDSTPLKQSCLAEGIRTSRENTVKRITNQRSGKVERLGRLEG